MQASQHSHLSGKGQCGNGHDAHPLPELRGYCKWIPRRRRSTSPTAETGSSQGDRESSSRSWDVETRIDAGKVSTLVPWTVTVSAPPCAIIARDHPPRWTARSRSPHTTLCGHPARWQTQWVNSEAIKSAGAAFWLGMLVVMDVHERLLARGNSRLRPQARFDPTSACSLRSWVDRRKASTGWWKRPTVRYEARWARDESLLLQPRTS